MTTHPVVSVFLLHGVWVEEADDCARLRLPVLLVDLTEQQQRHKHLQVVEVVQLPDAEGFSLQSGGARSETQPCARTNGHYKWKNKPTLLLLCCVALLTSTAKVTQSLSSSFSRTNRSGSCERRIRRRLAIFRSMSVEDTRGFLKRKRFQVNLLACVRFKFGCSKDSPEPQS